MGPVYNVHLWTLFASIDAKKGCSWWGLRHANRTSHPIPISLAVRATSAKATKTICIFAFKRIARKLIYKIFTSNLTRWTYPVRKMCTTFYEYQVVISMMCVCLCVYFSLSFFLRVHVCLYVVCARTHWTSRGFFLHHFSKNLLLEPPCIKNHEPPFWRWKNRQSTTNNEWRKSKIVSRTNNCLANGGIIRKITTHGSRDSSSSCKSNKIAFFSFARFEFATFEYVCRFWCNRKCEISASIWIVTSRIAFLEHHIYARAFSFVFSFFDSISENSMLFSRPCGKQKSKTKTMS